MCRYSPDTKYKEIRHVVYYMADFFLLGHGDCLYDKRIDSFQPFAGVDVEIIL